MHALYVLLPALGIMAIAYRYYSAFLATKIWMLDDARQTPAHSKYDGANYYPTSKWVMFGHHFAAITGAGPLVGPMLAAQFGYAPGFIWLVAGCCLAGAVHDSMVLWASVRRGGKSLPDIVKQEISPFIGFVAAVAIIFILVMGMSFTGYLLVFDERAYWATIVGVNINGTAPILGPALSWILMVGPQISTHTLSRFYSLHMLVLPSLIGGLVAIHMLLVVRLGVTSPPWSRMQVTEGDA